MFRYCILYQYGFKGLTYSIANRIMFVTKTRQGQGELSVNLKMKASFKGVVGNEQLAERTLRIYISNAIIRSLKMAFNVFSI